MFGGEEEINYISSNFKKMFGSEEEINYISSKKAMKNCNDFKGLLNEYYIDWEFVDSADEPKIKIDLNSNEMYLIIDFLVPDGKDLYFQTWHEADGKFINPLRDPIHTDKLYHDKNNGFIYVIQQCGLFKSLQLAKHYW